jgi:hypothetical protein
MPVDQRVRRLLAVFAVVQAVAALGFAFGVPLVTELWPFPGSSPLSNAFIGSIFLAGAASTAWCLWVRSDRAVAGISLDYLAIFVPSGIFAFFEAAGGAGSSVAAFGVACIVGAVVGLMLLRWSLAHRWRDPRRIDVRVRWVFVVFIVSLVITGGRLVIQTPDVMPWQVPPQLSTLFGLMFLGAAAYFAYSLVDPHLENAGGQLAGFLAYDVVLIVPFLVRLPTVEERFRFGLIAYIVVLIVSGTLAVWALFIHPDTRIWPRPVEPAAGPAPV